MGNINKQGLLFKGIFEFEDPSGTLLAARNPQTGSLDLYSGSAVNVRPNQQALFIYKGKIADLMKPGLHDLDQGTVPILSRLVGLKYFFESKFRGEIWFFASHEFTGRRWGTSQPILHTFEDIGTSPIRAFGKYNLRIKDVKKFLLKLLGSRSSYDVTECEDFIQAQISELLPKALMKAKLLTDLNRLQQEISQTLEGLLAKNFDAYGIEVSNLQVVSALPSPDVLKALDERKAMDLIGDQRKYLIYKAANSLDSLGGGSSGGDTMQMMLGMMLGKSLLDLPAHSSPMSLGQVNPQKEKQIASPQKACTNCQSALNREAKFCSECGAKQP